MNIILLSGGSGQRLWPLSNDIRSKQFIRLFRTESGKYESMMQRMYRQIREEDPEARVTIATARTQVSAIRHQIGDQVDISAEPCRRGTFPAILLAAAYLRDRKGVGEKEAVVVCPVDPYVDEAYFRGIRQLGELAATGEAKLYLMGVTPAYPSEKYGYIIPESGTPVSPVRAFREKPEETAARRYIEEGALWNGGVFAFRIGYLLDIAREMIRYTDYEDLYARYDTLPRSSFDYAVVEKEPDMAVMRFAGRWKDMGTWNTLTEAMDDPCVGKAILNDTCENVHVLNELDIPVLCMGMKNAVIFAGPEGILVSDKEQSSYIGPYVDQLEQQIMYAEKSWGEFRVMDVEEGSMTIKVTLLPGHRMNYHSHAHRDEVWTILAGRGYTVVDGMKQPVRPGDVITMKAGCRHTIMAETELKLIEVQVGREISSQDKKKYEWE